jgi:3-hydroxyacyl-CoA dehydrogenase
MVTPDDHGYDVRVAVLGSGIMGSAMARRLVAAGLPTTVWDRSPSATAPLCASDNDRGGEPAGDGGRDARGGGSGSRWAVQRGVRSSRTGERRDTSRNDEASERRLTSVQHLPPIYEA